MCVCFRVNSKIVRFIPLYFTHIKITNLLLTTLLLTQTNTKTITYKTTQLLVVSNNSNFNSLNSNFRVVNSNYALLHIILILVAKHTHTHAMVVSSYTCIDCVCSCVGCTICWCVSVCQQSKVAGGGYTISYRGE